MRERLKRRPSSATVIAILALVAAVVGTAVAGPLVTKSVLNKREKKQTRSIARNVVETLAPGLSVAGAGTASTAGTAGTATNADKVDGADICSGTVNVPEGPDQTVCSSGPLFIRASCTVAAASTTGQMGVDTTQDGGWYVTENIADGATFTAVNDLDQGGSTELGVTDGSTTAGSAAAESLSVSLGHASAGVSINGHFSLEADRTGTDQGMCSVSMGAIAG